MTHVLYPPRPIPPGVVLTLGDQAFRVTSCRMEGERVRAELEPLSSFDPSRFMLVGTIGGERCGQPSSAATA